MLQTINRRSCTITEEATKEIQKMSPSTTGRCSRHAADHMDLLYLTLRHGRKNYIRRPDVVERIESYLGTSFPLFHAQASTYRDVLYRLLTVDCSSHCCGSVIFCWVIVLQTSEYNLGALIKCWRYILMKLGRIWRSEVSATSS